MAYVVIYTPTSPAQKMKLQGPTVVGRALGCGLWIADRKLSRQHCRIEPRGQQWFIVDLNSSNGTRLQGHRIRERALVEGDTIEVGNARIVFREGDYVVRRPLDPIEATSMGSGKLARDVPGDDLENSTLVGQKLAAKVVLPPGVAEMTPVDQKGPAMSLPFNRPPAQPIVKDESEQPPLPSDISSSSRWFKAIVSRLRRS